MTFQAESTNAASTAQNNGNTANAMPPAEQPSAAAPGCSFAVKVQEVGKPNVVRRFRASAPAVSSDTATHDACFREFATQLKSLLQVSDDQQLKLSYLDDEQELIGIESGLEYAEACRLALADKANVLRVTVEILSALSSGPSAADVRVAAAAPPAEAKKAARKNGKGLVVCRKPQPRAAKLPPLHQESEAAPAVVVPPVETAPTGLSMPPTTAESDCVTDLQNVTPVVASLQMEDATMTVAPVVQPLETPQPGSAADVPPSTSESADTAADPAAAASAAKPPVYLSDRDRALALKEIKLQQKLLRLEEKKKAIAAKRLQLKQERQGERAKVKQERQQRTQKAALAKRLASTLVIEGDKVKPQLVVPGAPAAATMRVRNSGTEPWPVGCRAKFQGRGLALPAALDAIQVNPQSPVEPSSETTFNVVFQAPQEEGVYTSFWKLQTPDGFFFGDNLPIKVRALTAQTALNLKAQRKAQRLAMAATPAAPSLPKDQSFGLTLA